MYGSGAYRFAALKFSAKEGGRCLRALSNNERASLVQHLGELLITRQAEILEANREDMTKAKSEGDTLTPHI